MDRDIKHIAKLLLFYPNIGLAADLTVQRNEDLNKCQNPTHFIRVQAYSLLQLSKEGVALKIP